MSEPTTARPMTSAEFSDLWTKLLEMRRGELVVVIYPTMLGTEHVRMLEAARFVLVSARDNQGVGGFSVIAREGENALAVAKAQEIIAGIGGSNAVVQRVQ